MFTKGKELVMIILGELFLMMNARRKKKNTFRWIVLIIILIILAIVCFVIWQNDHIPEDGGGEENSSVETGEEQGEEKEGEGSKLTVNVKSEEQMEEKKVAQYDGEDPNESNDLSGVVTYAEVVGSDLMIRENIDQYLTEGTCELILKRGGDVVYSSTVNIISGVSTSACEDFNISKNRLGEGDIEINIKLKAGDRTGVIRGEVNI